jgi:imidazolonepropionase-like amidohydrolase
MTANPAAMTGLADKAGSFAPGMPANLVAVNAAGRLAGSFVGGERVH